MVLRVKGNVGVKGDIEVKINPNTVLLTNFDGDAIDETGRHILTVGATGSISGSTFKFGTGSFEGINSGPVTPSTSFVSAPDSPDWEFGANPFTVECWVRFKSVDDIMSFVSHYTNTGNQRSWWLQWTGPSFSNILRFGYTTNGTTAIITDFTWNPLINTWYHLAVDRDVNNDIRTYIDGAVVATSNAGSNSIFNGTSPLFIGKLISQPFDDQPINGFIDDVRITKGTARHAGAFTVPTKGFKFPG